MKPPRLSALAACAVLVVVSACSMGGKVSDAMSPEDPTPTTPTTPVSLSANVEAKAADVKVQTLVSASAAHGTISAARLTTSDGKTAIAGKVSGSTWSASERLEPSTTYRLSVTGDGNDGTSRTLQRTFTTQALTLAQQTYPSVAPLQGETVGVGMPVIVTFDVAVKDRALFEKHMAVTSSPAVQGSWDWFSDREVHFRPKTFWPAHAKVNVKLDLNGLPAGNGIFGQQSQDINFTVGDAVVSVVNVARHRLKYTVDGNVEKTIPVTTGDSAHASREGTKVIMEKFSSVDMDAATTGVDSQDPGYYNIKDVRYAMRLTNSGEFLHAAPWSTGSQGSANVSHGCTGMSTADAQWLFEHSRRGDVVRYVQSPRELEDRNGWTDWNVPWSEWTAGSALS